jgi:hypothetical protein
MAAAAILKARQAASTTSGGTALINRVLASITSSTEHRDLYAPSLAGS